MFYPRGFIQIRPVSIIYVLTILIVLIIQILIFGIFLLGGGHRH